MEYGISHTVATTQEVTGGRLLKRAITKISLLPQDDVETCTFSKEGECSDKQKSQNLSFH